MERATRSETCPSGDERSAFGLFNKDTVDTTFGTSLETPLGQSHPVLNSSELGGKDRAEEWCRHSTLIFDVLFLFPFSVARIAHSTMNSELTCALQEQLRTDSCRSRTRLRNVS